MKYVKHLDEIVTAVSSEYGIPKEVILDAGIRTPAVVHARHVTEYIACKASWMSKRAIATYMNQKDHGSVFYGFNRIAVLMNDSVAIEDRVNGLIKKLTQ